jgi:hypothetical protein
LNNGAPSEDLATEWSVCLPGAEYGDRNQDEQHDRDRSEHAALFRALRDEV